MYLVKDTSLSYVHVIYDRDVIYKGYRIYREFIYFMERFMNVCHPCSGAGLISIALMLVYVLLKQALERILLINKKKGNSVKNGKRY